MNVFYIVVICGPNPTSNVSLMRLKRLRKKLPPSFSFNAVLNVLEELGVMTDNFHRN
jgi:hypothetical protein